MMGDRAVAQKPLFYEFSLDRHVPTDNLHSARISLIGGEGLASG
jgi:hypothetical protein